jgi:ribonuclease HII
MAFVVLDDAFAKAFNGLIVAGVDEVGRGPLAGPVVAAAVVIPEEIKAQLQALAGDSKKLTEKKRVIAAEVIHATCFVGIGEASVEEIDTVNIRNATFLAMRRALEKVQHGAVVVDGDAKIPELKVPQVCVVGGDGKELAVACASIVAKVYRDNLMTELAKEFPVYGWASNAGYGAAVHMAALKEVGVTLHHRKSFAPVKEALEMMEGQQRAA